MNSFLGASIDRPSTTAPSQGILDQSWFKSGAGTEPLSNKIMSPSPRVPLRNNASLLNASLDGFRIPDFLSHGASAEMSPEHSLGFHSAHISSDDQYSRQKLGEPPARQQPTPDSSMEALSKDRIQSVSLETSESRLLQSANIGPQRIFAPEYHRNSEDAQGHPTESTPPRNSKHSREPFTPDEQIQAKRQRIAYPPGAEQQSRRNIGYLAPIVVPSGSPDTPNPQQRVQSSQKAHPNLLSHILECDADQLVQRSLEHFQNRVNIWVAASDEDWNESAEELKQRINNKLSRTQDYMKRKRDFIATLEERINTHQLALNDRAQVLVSAKEKMASGCQDVLGHKPRE